MVFLMMEQLFTGPIDSLENLAYLNTWSYLLTFYTNLMQWKSANYEVEKKEAKTTDPSKKYPNSMWYKAFALTTLEIASALNFVNLIGFWFFVFPNSASAYDTAQLNEALGSTWAAQAYFFLRNYVVHTVPFLVTSANIFLADVVFMETDWYLMPTTAMFYLLVSFSVSAYSGKEQIYILKWTNTDTYIEFIPFMVMCAYMLALLSVHFIFCIITQVARQRYVNDFSKYNADPE